MVQLRPYQEKFVNDIRYSLAANKKIIACAATGSGKTKCFIAISKMAIEKGKIVLIISESRKIYRQIHQEIEDSENIGDGVKEENIDLGKKLFVSMGQTLARRENIIKWFVNKGEELLVINDEAHISTVTKLILQLPSALLIGFTATPSFKQGKHLPVLYNDIVIGSQPQELVEMGFLSPYYHFARKVVDLKNLKIKNGEFTEKSQEMAFEKRVVYDGLMEDLKKFDYKKGMIFCASIKHCEHLAQVLRESGYAVSVIHSKNKNSDYEWHKFLKEDVNLCLSVSSLTKGVDAPIVDYIFIQRAINSLPLFLQVCGRGSRVYPGKNNFTIVDYGSNAERHGLWNADRDWKLLWKGKQKDKGVAPIRECPKCNFLMAVRIMVCPNCGYVFVKDDEVKTPKETILVELTENYNKLRGRRIGELSAKELTDYVKLTKKKAFGSRIAKSKGDEFLKEYGQYMGWKRGWQRYIEPDTELHFANIVIR